MTDPQHDGMTPQETSDAVIEENRLASPLVEDEYSIGYGKPPKHSQFKKGQSGNPNGRPRKSRNLRTLIQEELETPVILQENGQQIKTTKAAAMSKRIVNKALSGDPRAIQTLIRMMPQEQQDDVVELSDDDLAAFIDLRQRIEVDHEVRLQHADTVSVNDE